MIPWLATHRNVSKQAVASRFRISLDQLEADLALDHDDRGPSRTRPATTSTSPTTATPWTSGSRRTSRDRSASPRSRASRCSPAAGRCSRCPAPTPTGPLATAVAKLEAALGVTEVKVELASPPLLAEVRAAAADGRRIEIDYWRAGRDELTTRRDRPRRRRSSRSGSGTPTRSATCAGSRGCSASTGSAPCTTTGEYVPARAPDAPARAVYHPRPDDPRVDPRAPRGASWVAETAPTRVGRRPRRTAGSGWWWR